MKDVDMKNWSTFAFQNYCEEGLARRYKVLVRY